MGPDLSKYAYRTRSWFQPGYGGDEDTFGSSYIYFRISSMPVRHRKADWLRPGMAYMYSVRICIILEKIPRKYDCLSLKLFLKTESFLQIGIVIKLKKPLTNKRL